MVELQQPTEPLLAPHLAPIPCGVPRGEEQHVVLALMVALFVVESTPGAVAVGSGESLFASGFRPSLVPQSAP